jgi:iron complex outermembrane receptor protein
MKKILLILLFLSNFAVYSQTDNPVDTDTTLCQDTLILSEVVIYSIRADEDKPVPQKTFSSYQLQKNYQGQDIPFFLNKHNPSIVVYSDGGNYNGYQYFRLRGIDQTRINMTLNGVPLNEPEDQGAYFSNYPDYTKNISSMQVQRGIGISSNGVASYGGSINFESFDLESDHAVDINVGYGSFNTKRFSVGVNNKIGKFHYYTRYSNVGSDGYRNNSGTNGQSFFFSGGYFGEKDILKVTGFLGQSQNQMAYLASPVDSIKANRKHNPLSPNENDDFRQSHIQLQYTRKLNSNLSLVNTVYYTYLLGSYDVFFSPDMLYFKLNSNFYGAITNLAYNKNNLGINVGVHVNNYERTHSMTIKPDITNNLYSNTGKKNEESLFLKAQYKLGNFTPYIDLQLRNVNFSYSPEASYNLSFKPINWLFFNPKAGISYKKNEFISFYGFIGKTFREPTRNDMFGGADDIDPSNYNDVSNFKRVKPESVVDFELGANYHYKKLIANLNFFHMQFKNEIAPIGQLSYIGLPLRKNVASSYRRGIEIDLKYAVTNKIKVWGNGTYMFAQIKEYTTDYDNKTYNNVTPLLTPNIIANLGVDYKLCKYFNLNADMKYLSQSYLDNTNNDNLILPEYAVFNLHSTIFLKNDFNITMNVNNIMNTKYYNSGYAQGTSCYFVAPTRNYFVTVNKKF